MESSQDTRSSFDNPSMTLRLGDTMDMTEIEQAVYGSNLARRSMVSRNQLLTQEHCRHLITVLDYPTDRAFLVEHPAFPTDLLWELAKTEESDFVLGFIIDHPNANAETKACVALRGYVDVSSWK